MCALAFKHHPQSLIHLKPNFVELKVTERYFAEDKIYILENCQNFDFCKACKNKQNIIWKKKFEKP